MLAHKNIITNFKIENCNCDVIDIHTRISNKRFELNKFSTEWEIKLSAKMISTQPFFFPAKSSHGCI